MILSVPKQNAVSSNNNSKGEADTSWESEDIIF